MIAFDLHSLADLTKQYTHPGNLSVGVFLLPPVDDVTTHFILIPRFLIPNEDVNTIGQQIVERLQASGKFPSMPISFRYHNTCRHSSGESVIYHAFSIRFESKGVPSATLYEALAFLEQ